MGLIGDDRHTEDRDGTVTGHNHLRYRGHSHGISAGKTPSKLDQKDLVDGVNGTAEGLTLVVDDPADNRFFKVIRK